MICILVFLCSSFIRIKSIIYLNGKDEITLNLHEIYQEQGAIAKVPFSKKTLQVKISGTVDSKKIGNYKIIYQIYYQGNFYQKVRIVHVVDKIAPNLLLKGAAKVYICPNHTYIEEGYEAIDNYDGDLTNAVQVQKFFNHYLYTVRDSSLNETSITRDIIHEDLDKPNLILKGGEVLILYVGDTYQEPGYEAIDNCDFNLTNHVKITGTVNTNLKGIYEKRYEVEDLSGNLKTVKRTIQVLSKPNDNEKVIYLTFDDGPSNSITPELLDILKEENVKATFFVINHADSLNPLIKREVLEGHTVGIHSYSHNYRKIYASSKAYFEDLEVMSQKIMTITGKKTNIIRFPGGSSNTVSRFHPGIMTDLTKEVLKRGYQYFDWNISSGDAGEVKNANQVYQNVIRNLNNQTNIVLMHDFENNYHTLNALRDIIQYGKQMGYTFRAITDTTPSIHHHINN